MSTNAWRISFVVCFTVEATWLAAAGVWPLVPILCAGIAVSSFVFGMSMRARRAL